MLGPMLRAAAGNAGGGIPTAGLIAHYTMDSISGSTLTDDVGNYDGTIYGATQVPGKIGNALSFDGNDYVSTSGFSGPVNAISFWVYSDSPRTSASSAEIVLDFDDTDDDQAQITLGASTSHATDETLLLGDGSGGAGFGRTYIKDTIPAGWSHIVINWNGSQYDIFVNGSQKTTYAGSDSGHCGRFYGNIDKLTLGRWGSGTYNRFLNGALDSMRFYSVSLSDSDIAALYAES